MSGYSTTVLADNPIRYYRLDEAAYKVADASGNNRHGAASSSGITYGVGSLVGNSDTCMTFDGTNGLVVTPPFGIPSGTNPTFSMECWCKFSSNPASTQVLLHLGDWTGSDGPFIGINSSGQALSGTHTLTGTHGSTGLSGAAHYIALTYDGTTATLYVDGASVGTYAGGIVVSALGAHIAEIIGKQFMFAGTIAQVAIYNVKLSSTQVSNHFGATGAGYDAAILADSPVQYFKLNDTANGSTVITDSSTSTQNATMASGMATATSLLTGDSDTSYFFGGAAAATIPTTSLPTGNAAWSLEAWVETAGTLPVSDTSPGVMLQMGNWSTTKAAPFLGIDTSGKPRVDTFGAASAASSALSFNARHHLVGTWDGTTLTLYVDGSSAATSTPGALAVTQTGAFIGASANGTTNAYIGVIDEVAIYSTTLSAAQVLAHWNAGANPANNITLATSIVEVETVSASMQGVTLAKPLPQYNLWIRSNSTLQLVDVLNDYYEIEARLNFNGVSAIVVGVDPLSTHVSNLLLQSGTDYVNGLIFQRDNQDGNGPQLLFSGPIIDVAMDFDASRKPELQMLVTAESDDIVLEDRCCLPVLNYPYSGDILANDTSLVRYYRLGEASGTTAVDASGHANGTYAGSGVTYAVAPGIDDSDTAVTLDGIAGKVTIPTSGLPTGNSSWSLAAWVQWSALPGSNQVILFMGTTSTNQGVYIGLGTTGLFGSTWTSPTAQYATTAGDWHHVALKWDGTIMTLYVDGLPRQTLTPGALNITYGAAYIGSSGGGNFFAGSIDEAEIIGVNYTDARVLHNYNVGLNRFYEGPAYDARTGVASTIMQQYVQYNAGSLALPERQTANFSLAADPLIGGTVDESVRFHNLLETCQNISLRASNEIGFIVRQTMNPSSNTLQMTIFQPRNQETAAFFSLALGNLIKFSYQANGVNANVAYSGGSGSGTTRPIVKHLHVPSITRSHKRREKFYNDSQYTTTKDLHTQASAHLTQDKDLVIVGFEAIDTEDCVFLRDYKLGDLVSVIIQIPNQTAITVQDIVRQVTITLKKGSGNSFDQTIEPIIGAPGTAHPLTPGRALNKALKTTTARIDQLQNNQ